MDDHFATLRRAYLSLGVGELASVLVFTAVGAGTFAPQMSRDSERALWCALVPLLLVLVQGGVYWLVARRWLGRPPMPSGFARVYRILRVLDPVLLTAALLGVVVSWPQSPAAAILVLLVWLFGVAEYVNYFVVRLSYPVGHWFSGVRRGRVPVLVRDLRRSR